MNIVDKRQPSSVQVWGIKTCDSTRKALQYLMGKGIETRFHDFRTTLPPKSLLQALLTSVEDPRKAFNTTGASYRLGGFKDTVGTMSKKEIIALLQSDPMLIKRPVVLGPSGVHVGWTAEGIDAVL
jgi:arsenate reductase (glutaredoxin)